MGPAQLGLVETCLQATPANDRIVIETGAGLSSVWMLQLGYTVHSFVMNEAVVDRMQDFLSKFPDLSANWYPHVGASELTLPVWSLKNQEVRPALALIDGGHGMQTVFLDFVYTNLLLRKGGILLVDDQQLGAIRLLDNILIESRDYRVLEATDKLIAYQKLSDKPLLSDWKTQETTQKKLSDLL